MPKIEATITVKETAPAPEVLKPINDDILTQSAKLVEAVKASGEIVNNNSEVSSDHFINHLPEGIDEKLAKVYENYITTSKNVVTHAAAQLGHEHLLANPTVDTYTLKMKTLGRNHVSSVYHRGTSAEDAGSVTTDVKTYDVGRNMGQYNLITKHANAAAREAFKFD